MSLILDALNRNRQERQAPEVPGIDTVPAAVAGHQIGDCMVEQRVIGGPMSEKACLIVQQLVAQILESS